MNGTSGHHVYLYRVHHSYFNIHIYKNVYTYILINTGPRGGL